MLADFHMHTRASDGRALPGDMVRAARARGLGAVAITDHNTFAGSVAAARAGVEGVIVVYGSEVRTEYGDVVVLCPSQPSGEAPRSLVDLIEFAEAESCLAFPAHPYDVRRLGIGPLVRLRYWRAVEGWNAASDPLSNALSWLATSSGGKVVLANSDAHVPEAVGAAGNLLPDVSTRDEVLEVIRKGLTSPVPGYSISGFVRSLEWSIIRYLTR